MPPLLPLCRLRGSIAINGNCASGAVILRNGLTNWQSTKPERIGPVVEPSGEEPTLLPPGQDLQDRRAPGRNWRRGVTELTGNMTRGTGFAKKRLNSEWSPLGGSHVGAVNTAFAVLVIAPDAPMPEKIANSPEPSP